MAFCGPCKGTGKSDVKGKFCIHCKGRGVLKANDPAAEKCYACRGSGKENGKRCHWCNGSGKGALNKGR